MRPVKPGICLCPVCGRTTDIAYYTASNKAIGATLIKTLTGYQLKADPPSDDHDAEETIRLKNTNLELDDGAVPHELVAVYQKADGKKDEVRMRRSCPNCKETRTTFHRCQGKVPMYVIAAIGASSAGKSAWIGAASSDALSWVNELPYLYKIKPYTLSDTIEPGGATTKESQGNSNFFEIIEKSTNKVVALVFIMDTAGENYTKSNLDSNSNLDRLLKGDGVHYKGISGAMIFDPAVKTNISGGAKSKNENAVKIYNSLRETLEQLPVAYIRTFADLLIAQETERTEESGELPLICEDTFVNMGDSHASRYQLKELFTPEQLRSRIALQNYITGSTRLKATVFSMIDGVRTSGFLVQSCVACQNGRDNDYTQQFNVVDPLLWILDQFGIFPSYIEEGK